MSGEGRGSALAWQLTESSCPSESSSHFVSCPWKERRETSTRSQRECTAQPRSLGMEGWNRRLHAEHGGSTPLPSCWKMPQHQLTPQLQPLGSLWAQTAHQTVPQFLNHINLEIINSVVLRQSVVRQDYTAMGDLK